jgi:2-polyprenyl-3-methyl-5-hydroxy-6-metoxy-1,4-benzoquinol methylase
MHEIPQQFQRTHILLGDEGIARLARMHVFVAGLGGVGSYCADALARAGIGRLTLLDHDVVATSNINRQLPALLSTVGEPKVRLMSLRVHDINPKCQVHAERTFLDTENINQLVPEDVDYVVDAIDSLACKVALVGESVKRGRRQQAGPDPHQDRRHLQDRDVPPGPPDAQAPAAPLQHLQGRPDGIFRRADQRPAPPRTRGRPGPAEGGERDDQLHAAAVRADAGGGGGAEVAAGTLEQEREAMGITPEQVEAGQAVYTKRTLAIYDFVVLGVSNRFVWKCPTRRIEEHYNTHLTANHLDVGVGTGYFLDRCRFPSHAPRVALMDLNADTLDFASRRIARYKPETYRRNVLQPVSLDTARFDSVGINYLLHCLPGTIESKAAVFDHLKALMKPDAVLFGSTLLQGGVTRNWFAGRLMEAYNRKGVFSNRNDGLEGLKRELGRRFKDVSVEVVGCAALFSGRA